MSVDIVFMIWSSETGVVVDSADDRQLSVGWIAGRLTGRRMGVLAVNEGPPHFEPLAQLCVTGDVGIHIDRTFGLDDVPDALAYVGEGHAVRTVIEARCAGSLDDRSAALGCPLQPP